MNTLDIIQKLCVHHQYMRQLSMQHEPRVDRDRMIYRLRLQIEGLKKLYREIRKKQLAGMLYEHDGRYYLADRQITFVEFHQARKLKSLMVA